MTNWRLLFTIGFAHAAADAVSGFTVVSVAAQGPLWHMGAIVLAYNLVAFGLQPAIGYVIDRRKTVSSAPLFGMVLIAIGLCLFHLFPLLALGCIAVGSAAFHAGAGAGASLATPEKSIGPALFTGPGVIGLAVGTVAGLTAFPSLACLFAAVFLAIVCLAGCMQAQTGALRQEPGSFLDQKVSLTAVFVITPLLLGIACRSWVWTAYSTTSFGIEAILFFGLAAGFGKIFGGIAADAWGARVVVPATLLLALACFLAPSFLLVVPGLFFLQSSTPIILAAVTRRLPKFPATGAGLVLGLALVAGAVLVRVMPLAILRMPAILTTIVIATAILFSCGLALQGGAWSKIRR